jgi:5-methylthioribose kinase
VVVKQALPYLKIVGDAWLLPLRRSFFEYEALCEEARHVPHLVPKPYHFDEPAAAIEMEYLTPHIILRKGFIRGTVYPKLASHIAEFMAQTLFKTSDLFLDAASKKKWVALFCENIELCKITEDLVFTDPYRIAKLNRDPRVQAEAVFSESLEFRVIVRHVLETVGFRDIHSSLQSNDRTEMSISLAYGPAAIAANRVSGQALLLRTEALQSACGDRTVPRLGSAGN